MSRCSGLRKELKRKQNGLAREKDRVGGGMYLGKERKRRGGPPGLLQLRRKKERGRTGPAERIGPKMF
jgi:hypothetical protein